MTSIAQPYPIAQTAVSSIPYDGGLACALSVTDLDVSLAWYRDVLGMELLHRRDDIAWCEFATSVARVTVGLSQTETAGGGGGATLTFGVTDIDAAKAVLDAAGVRQDGGIDEVPELVRLLTFYDPDGNALMFYQDLSGG
ncbi:MAG: VOC family protein [Alphaproteobacteria bacterium]|nr:MAG: VOC family protein [Alphaproteobacteria bacterium]